MKGWNGWWENARCRGVTIKGVPFDEVNSKFAIDRARAVCEQCPVLQQCLDEALALEHPLGRADRSGFRAGMTRKERHRLARQGSVAA